MTKWQPIETAPKDGRDVLVWDEETRTTIHWGNAAHVLIYGWIKIAHADPQDPDLMQPQPTHWMPLPQPPEDDE